MVDPPDDGGPAPNDPARHDPVGSTWTSADLGRSRSGEEELFDLFEDVESQAEAQFAADRDLEVADRAVMEYREVTWLSRLRGSEGGSVQVHVTGVGTLAGTLARVGEGWCELASSRGVWILRSAEVLWIGGTTGTAVPDAAVRITDKRSIASPLRKLAQDGARVGVHLVDGTTLGDQLGRVGADFCELKGTTAAAVVPFSAIVGLQVLPDGW